MGTVKDDGRVPVALPRRERKEASALRADAENAEKPASRELVAFLVWAPCQLEIFVSRSDLHKP